MEKKLYSFKTWHNDEELYAQLQALTSETETEIERKWLIVPISPIQRLSADYEIVSHLLVRQWYLSIDPELRFREVVHLDDPERKLPIEHFLACKSGTGLVRSECEVMVDDATALRILQYINKHSLIDVMNLAIEKDYYCVRNGKDPDAPHIEITMINDRHNPLNYIEVEFISEYKASMFELPREFRNYVIREVTEDDSYKMKNYWKRSKYMYYTKSYNDSMDDILAGKLTGSSAASVPIPPETLKNLVDYYIETSEGRNIVAEIRCGVLSLRICDE